MSNDFDQQLNIARIFSELENLDVKRLLRELLFDDELNDMSCVQAFPEYIINVFLNLKLVDFGGVNLLVLLFFLLFFLLPLQNLLVP